MKWHNDREIKNSENPDNEIISRHTAYLSLHYVRKFQFFKKYDKIIFIDAIR